MRKAFGSDKQRIGHALAVLRAAEEIGREAGADPFVLVPAAIFHDVGRSLPHCGDAEHGPEGRRLTAELLADLHIPGAVQDEILSLIEHHHERDRMAAPTRAAPNGAVLFDADLIVNLEESRRADAPSVLEREALTEAGKRVGRSWLRAGH
jgi:HD superfamily phosphodiesterase